MNEKVNIDFTPLIQNHLNTFQAVIQRMAANSASSKTWCITIVSAILMILINNDKHDYILIALIPIVLFMFLDIKYLALEKGFRLSFENFVKKIHENTVDNIDLLIIKPSGNKLFIFLKASISFSTWPFYLILTGIIFIIKYYINI